MSKNFLLVKNKNIFKINNFIYDIKFIKFKNVLINSEKLNNSSIYDELKFFLIKNSTIVKKINYKKNSITIKLLWNENKKMWLSIKFIFKEIINNQDYIDLITDSLIENFIDNNLILKKI